MAELLASIREDLLARYKSPFWGPALLALVAYHWRVVVYLATEKHKATDVISFIQDNVSKVSVITALAYVSAYIVLFPWIEWAFEWLASRGKRKRNDLQARERERGLAHRKLIAQEEAKTLEMRLENLSNQSKLADVDLVKAYQAVLSGENFSRWLSDLQRGPVNSSLNNTIVNYLHKVDSTEGKFINPSIESAHNAFVNDLSTLLSALNDSRNEDIEVRKQQIIEFSKKAKNSQKVYRDLARQLLGV